MTWCKRQSPNLHPAGLPEGTQATPLSDVGYIDSIEEGPEDDTCLPLWQESGLCLVLLSARQDAFHMLADSAARLQRELAESGVPQVRHTQRFHQPQN